MAETHQLDERHKNSRGDNHNKRAGNPTNTHKNGYISRHKKRRESTQQRTRIINAHANMEIHYDYKS